MNREMAVNLYNIIVQLRPEWHSDKDNDCFIKVLITGSIMDSDRMQPHIRANQQSDRLLWRFRNPGDPLKLVITSGMWLTGVDMPLLHTLYIYKPMRGPSLLQAIARVSRVSEGKQHGLVVDCWGLKHEIEELLGNIPFTAESG